MYVNRSAVLLGIRARTFVALGMILLSIYASYRMLEKRHQPEVATLCFAVALYAGYTLLDGIFSMQIFRQVNVEALDDPLVIDRNNCIELVVTDFQQPGSRLKATLICRYLGYGQQVLDEYPLSHGIAHASGLKRYKMRCHQGANTLQGSRKLSSARWYLCVTKNAFTNPQVRYPITVRRTVSNTSK